MKKPDTDNNIKKSTNDTSNYIDHGYGPRPKHKPLQFKRGTAQALWAQNPILLSGQPAYELDTKKLKIGDGHTRYTALPYIGDGKDGKSAYELWRDARYEGDIDDFLDYCVGPAGKSAYEIWLDLGNEGTMLDFINSLHGDKGEKGDKGDKGDQGDEGKSAYDIWIEAGHTGTIADFLESLQGKSAYQIWLDLGHTGTEQDFIDSLKGEKGDKGDKGDDGDDAFETWKKEMGDPTLTFDDFIAMLTSETWVSMEDE